MNNWDSYTEHTAYSGIWGDWHSWTTETSGYFYIGARVKYEGSLGGGEWFLHKNKNDDTAMNGIG